MLANPRVSQLPRRAGQIRELSPARALFELPMLAGQIACPSGVHESGYEGRRICYAFVAHHDIQGFLHAVDVAETLLEVIRPSSQVFASVF